MRLVSDPFAWSHIKLVTIYVSFQNLINDKVIYYRNEHLSPTCDLWTLTCTHSVLEQSISIYQGRQYLHVDIPDPRGSWYQGHWFLGMCQFLLLWICDICIQVALVWLLSDNTVTIKQPFLLHIEDIGRFRKLCLSSCWICWQMWTFLRDDRKEDLTRL